MLHVWTLLTMLMATSAHGVPRERRRVARVPTRDIDTLGIVGLRVNHQRNLHVSALTVAR